MLSSLLPTFENNSIYYGDCMSATFACLPFAGNCWTILYNGICLAVILSGISIHPGADIAMDFLGCGLNWAMGIMLFIWVAYPYYLELECDLEYSNEARCALAKKVAGIEYTGAVLTVFVGYVKLLAEAHTRPALPRPDGNFSSTAARTWSSSSWRASGRITSASPHRARSSWNLGALIALGLGNGGEGAVWQIEPPASVK